MFAVVASTDAYSVSVGRLLWRGAGHRFYRAMHCSAKRCLEIVCRLSVRL